MYGQNIIALLIIIAMSLFIIIVKRNRKRSFSMNFWADFIGVPLIIAILNFQFIEVLEKILQNLPPYLSMISTPILAAVLAVLLVLIINIFYSLVLSYINPSIDKLIGKDSRVFLLGFLLSRLELINESVGWTNDKMFIDLEADVEIRYKNEYKSISVDLLDALKKRRRKNESCYLVIGAPGSGKSVAMRKLTNDMLKRAKHINKIPIYINLKEWEILKFNALNPDISDVESFILYCLKKYATPNQYELIDDCFSKLLKDHALFFIFDSYDELPALVSGRNSYARNSLITEAIYRFVKASGSECILASRPFRRPSDKYRTNTIFEIKPLDDIKIIAYLKKNVESSTRKLKKIYKENSEIIRCLRFPIIASLFLNYFNRHGKCPANQTILYDDFIEDKINDQLTKKFAGLEISFDDVFNVASYLAYLMISSEEIKLELSCEFIKQQVSENFAGSIYELMVDSIIHILTDSHICRFSDIEHNKIMFSHNRYQEYFFISTIGFETEIDSSLYEDITNCGPYFDILALYCEVAPQEKVDEIAYYCAEVVEENSDYNDIHNPDCIRAVNCLSFMATAFNSKSIVAREPIQIIKDTLINTIDKCKEFICLSVFAELNSIFVNNLIAFKLLKHDNYYINEIIIRSAHINNMSSAYEKVAYFESLERYSIFEFIKRLKYFMFILTINHQTVFLRNYCVLRITDALISIVAFFAGLSLIGIWIFNEINELWLPWYSISVIAFIVLYIIVKDFIFLKMLFVIPYVIYSLLSEQILPMVIASLLFMNLYFQLQELLVIKEKIAIFRQLENRKTRNDIKSAFSWIPKVLLSFTFIIIFIVIIQVYLKTNNTVIDFIMRLFVLIIYLIIALLVICLICLLLTRTISKSILKKYKPKSKTFIERANIEETIQSLKWNWLINRYIIILSEMNIKFTGEWSEERPFLVDDTTNRLLANMDIRDLNLYRNR